MPVMSSQHHKAKGILAAFAQVPIRHARARETFRATVNTVSVMMMTLTMRWQFPKG